MREAVACARVLIEPSLNTSCDSALIAKFAGPARLALAATSGRVECSVNATSFFSNCTNVASVTRPRLSAIAEAIFVDQTIGTTLGLTLRTEHAIPATLTIACATFCSSGTMIAGAVSDGTALATFTHPWHVTVAMTVFKATVVFAEVVRTRAMRAVRALPRSSALLERDTINDGLVKRVARACRTINRAVTSLRLKITLLTLFTVPTTDAVHFAIVHVNAGLERCYVDVNK